jgi:spermidine/putrescine-binding protein
MQFINFMLDSESAQMVSKEFPYLCPNTKAVAAMGSDYTDNPAKNPPADVIASGEYLEDLDSDTLSIYNDMWNKLKQ